jgi:hypothetical protein
MRKMRRSSKLKTRASGLVLVLALIGATSSNALAQDAASIDDGNRLIVPYHWKIEHRAKSPIDIFVHQLGTSEGRKLLATVATIVGFDPTLATIVSANVPLPHLDPGTTDNKGLLAAPDGMTICKAGPIGQLEASHASWSSSIVRNNKQNGLGFYTSVGTSPGQTHRIEGSFYVEYVKPVDGWEKKFDCIPDGKLVWNLHDS